MGCFKGDIEFVKILLNVGANPNTFSEDGVTPKWRANDFGLVEIEYLLDCFGGKIQTNEKFNSTAFLVFNNIIEQNLPNEDLNKGLSKDNLQTTKKKWRKFWNDNACENKTLFN